MRAYVSLWCVTFELASAFICRRLEAEDEREYYLQSHALKRKSLPLDQSYLDETKSKLEATLLKKGYYGNTFRDACRTVLLWHPKGVTTGVIRHPKGVLFGVNILPCGVHKHSASVH